jgi:hypothetical protein
MKLAVMQPYLFPYIGYFQLVNAVDKFVFYDDVTFINKGWINRNRILVNCKPHLFTVPLLNANQNTLIKDLKLAVSEKWKYKFLKTLEFAYKKAKYFSNVFPDIESVVNEKSMFLFEWHLKSFHLIMNSLGIRTKLEQSSDNYYNQHLKGQRRILDICTKENCEHYINPEGGIHLYNKQMFKNKRIKLSFLITGAITYKQFESQFISRLSIIDVLMFNSVDRIGCFLNKYKLV